LCMRALPHPVPLVARHHPAVVSLPQPLDRHVVAAVLC
jgi:hypothetical protein